MIWLKMALIRLGWAIGLCCLFLTANLCAQDDTAPSSVANPPTQEDTAPGAGTAPAPPRQVEVNPRASDESIADRLTRIMGATGAFRDVEVRTDQGVVFLYGIAEDEAHRQWAEQLAQNTTDVVAVVNNLAVPPSPLWDLTPAWAQLRQLGQDTVRAMPLVLVGIAVAVLFYFLAAFAARLSYAYSRRRIASALLQQVLASVVSVLVFLVGLYIALKISGLTRLAVTVLGGTGLAGLALGFAFRDIAENYLASILISLNHPFRAGDLIEVDGNKGFVRRVTTRGTILATLEGDQIHVPNSTVYKNAVRNFTSAPTSQLSFDVGIGYDDSIVQAQQVAMEVIRAHEATLADPEPLVLATKLGAATVNLQCLFWFDLSKYNGLKVKSAILRQVKSAFMGAGISMPDEAREVVFPKGVPVSISRPERAANGAPRGPQNSPRATLHDAPASPEASPATETNPDTSEGEGNLTSDAETIQRHADQGTVFDQSPDLLAE